MLLCVTILNGKDNHVFIEIFLCQFFVYLLTPKFSCTYSANSLKIFSLRRIQAAELLYRTNIYANSRFENYYSLRSKSFYLFYNTYGEMLQFIFTYICFIVCFNLQVSRGSTIPIIIKGVITYPFVTLNTKSLNFQTVVVGECLMMSVLVKNEWRIHF